MLCGSNVSPGNDRKCPTIRNPRRHTPDTSDSLADCASEGKQPLLSSYGGNTHAEYLEQMGGGYE
jgi:hypothetical protein